MGQLDTVCNPQAARRNICVAVQEKVPSNADEGKFRSIITNLLVKSTRAIILFTRADDARSVSSQTSHLLETISNLCISFKQFVETFLTVNLSSWEVKRSLQLEANPI